LKKYSLHIKYLFLLLLVVFLFGFASQRNLNKKIGDVRVVFENGENLFISYDMVNKLLIQNFDPNQNQTKENINLNSLEAFVQSNEMIENAEIFLTIKGDLGVIIRQRTPVLRVANSTGSYYYDSQGEKMPLSDNYSARVPITSSELNFNDCDDIICLSNEIISDDFLQKQIIGIDQIEGNGTNQFELRTRLGDQIIIFGDMKRVDEKIKKLKVFYQKAVEDKTLETYRTINLKFNNQVVCAK
jgi:cell division protein FtsQ